MSSSRGSSQPRDQTLISTSPALPGRFFTTSTTWEAHSLNNYSCWLIQYRLVLRFSFGMWNLNLCWDMDWQSYIHRERNGWGERSNIATSLLYFVFVKEHSDFSRQMLMHKFTLRKLSRPGREIWSMLDEVVTEKSARTDHSKMWLARCGRCQSF